MFNTIKLSELFDLGVNVTVTGIVLVFAMLLLLVLVLYIFGWISTAIQKAANKKSAAENEKIMREMADVNLPSATLNEAVSEGAVPNEVIAAISAAVNEFYSGSAVKPVIRSVKRSSGNRSAWAKAGIADNTRTF